MASTTTTNSLTNGQPGNPMNNSTSQSSATRGSMRSNNSMRGTDAGRRQSPVDGGQRRNNPPRAWSQNINAGGQRNSPYPHQMGPVHNRKADVSPRPPSGRESNTADLHAHDRLVFLLTAFIGLQATITTKSGEKFTGIFSGSRLEQNDTSFMLKMARRYSPDGDSLRSNGLSDQSVYLGTAPDHQMIFDAQEVVSVSVPNASTAGVAAKEQNGTAAGFRTDSDISAGHHLGRERELQRWEPGSDAPVDMSLESSDAAGWDQFETNARLFGATTSYDENIYTTRIDRNDPSYKRKEAEAARIAREIESSLTDNPHMQEERGQTQEHDTTGEEERYSGVRRGDAEFPPLQSGQPNKYTPPARRPPTGKPTVPGAPVDPAIISAQIAKPKPTEQKPSATPTTKPGAEAPKEPVTAAEQSKPSEPSKPLQTAKAPPPGKPDTDSETKNPPPKPALNSLVSPPKRSGVAEKTGSHVGTEVLDQFRQFANIEKMKLQECRRNQASYDRTIKLNELMKFSQNFKLGTPVPKDLIPILAKDRNKQEEIVERARRQHEEKMAAKTAAAVSAPASNKEEQKPASALPTGPAARQEPPPPPQASAPPPDRQPFVRGRQGYPPTGPAAGRTMPHQALHSGRAPSGMLSHRLADIQQQRKGAGISVPAPLSMNDNRAPPPSGPTSAEHKTLPTPTTIKFNARAMEFKPNPAASSFTPGGTSAVSSSPASNARTRSISRAASPSAFFGPRELMPTTEKLPMKDHFNPVKRMKKEATEQSTKDFAFNGGIPPAYRTPPTWEVSPVNKDRTYADMFKGPAVAPTASPQARSASNPQMPHHHQLPFHMQQGNHNVASGPPHVIHPQQQHPTGPPHFDDPHRMQISASSSQAYPSPRLPHTHMAFQSPMTQHAHLAMPQQVPQFYMGQGPHGSHVRHFPGGPQYVSPQNGMGAPMMVQQPSSGPYMAVPQSVGGPYNPQMQMYSPSPAHAYPHGQPPPQPHSGYPSPSRGAPMMVHQGSQQGHPSPVMYMNPGPHGQPYYGPQQPGHMPPRPGHQQPPQFSSSPHQAHHYPHQYRGPGNNYNQVPHMPPPHMQNQGPPPAAPAGPHPPDNAEEVK